MFKNHLNLKIEQNKPSMHTVGENIFKKYKTPSFVSPNSSKQTEKIPSISETTSSKLTSNNEQIVGSSMIEKHTIIFESEVENIDNQSEAPTESQHAYKEKRSVKIDESSLIDATTPKDCEIIHTLRRDSSKVESDKPEGFPIKNNKDQELPIFGKKRSQSDIYYDDVDLEQYEDDERAAKTAFISNRLRVGFATIKKQEQSEESENRAPSIAKPDNTQIDEDLNNGHTQTEIKNEDKNFEELNKGDEIYLNANSTEENPDAADDIPKDSYSVSKHTVLIGSNSHENLDNEGESHMSEKENEIRPEKVDRCLQITPADAPHLSEQNANDKNLQIESMAKLKSNKKKDIDNTLNIS